MAGQGHFSGMMQLIARSACIIVACAALSVPRTRV